MMGRSVKFLSCINVQQIFEFFYCEKIRKYSTLDSEVKFRLNNFPIKDDRNGVVLATSHSYSKAHDEPMQLMEWTDEGCGLNATRFYAHQLVQPTHARTRRLRLSFSVLSKLSMRLLITRNFPKATVSGQVWLPARYGG